MKCIVNHVENIFLSFFSLSTQYLLHIKYIIFIYILHFMYYKIILEWQIIKYDTLAFKFFFWQKICVAIFCSHLFRSSFSLPLFFLKILTEAVKYIYYSKQFTYHITKTKQNFTWNNGTSWAKQNNNLTS